MKAQKWKNFACVISLILSFVIAQGLSALGRVRAQVQQDEIRTQRRLEKFRTPPFYPKKIYPRSAPRRTIQPPSRKTNKGKKAIRSEHRKGVSQ